jgi:hypothetical protein
MKLNAIVETQPEPTFGGAMTKALLDDIDRRDTIAKLAGPHLQGVPNNDSLGKIADKVEDSLERARTKAFKKYKGNLPKAIEQTIAITESRKGMDINLFHEDHLTHASKQKKGSLSNLREIADKLGFVIAPYMYVRDEVLNLARTPKTLRGKRGDKSYYINPAIAFNDKLSEHFDVHVLGPLSIYDINKHVTSKDQAQMYWDTSNPVIASVEMVLPALHALNSRVSKVENRVESVEDSVGKMSAQLDKLEQQIAEDKKREAMEKRSMAERIAKLEARQFAARDPLIFAVEKGTDISTADTFAILGPCWGEDFDDIVLASLGLL